MTLTYLVLRIFCVSQKVKPFGGIVQVDANTGESELLLDPDGSVVSQFFGITCYKGKAYIGSLKNNFIAVFTPKD